MKLKQFWVTSAEPTSLRLPLMASRVSCGFPSPADDFLDSKLDLNQFLITHPAATIFAWAHGDSLKDRGIDDGDLLIVDRAVSVEHQAIVIASLDGELTCKVWDKKRGFLLPANDKHAPIDIKGQESLLIEGVVVHSIKRHY